METIVGLIAPLAGHQSQHAALSRIQHEHLPVPHDQGTDLRAGPQPARDQGLKVERRDPVELVEHPPPLPAQGRQLVRNSP